MTKLLGDTSSGRGFRISGPKKLLFSNPKVYFTTPHFDGYPAVLVRLDRIRVSELEELLVEAWMDRAPRRLAKEYLNLRLGRKT